MFERSILAFIKLARSFFRNTWVHRLPITTIVYRGLFRLLYGGIDKKVLFRGHRFIISTRDITIAPSLISHEYEAFELDIFEQLLQPGMTVLDIGANIGIYAIPAGNRVGAGGRVLAFEPVPENLDRLGRNVELNNLSNVEIVPAAVGSGNGRIRIVLEPKDIGTHSVAAANPVGVQPPSDEAQGYVDVPLTTIDHFVAHRSVQPDVIKMDIEGYEPFAIQGAKRTLQQQPILFIEFSAPLIKRYGSDPLALVRYLMKTYDFGYVIDERARKLLPIRQPIQVRRLWNANLLFLPADSAHRLGVGM